MFKLALEVFWTFFKIGAFTLGGGYAMIPLIEDEIVRNKKWLSEEEFMEALLIAQSSPGVLACNTAIVCGTKISGKLGTFFGILGSISPSFLIILFLSKFIFEYKDNDIFVGFFNGIKPATVALIFITVYKMSKNAKLNIYSLAIALAVALVIYLFHISPIVIILLTMILGNLFLAKKEENK